MLNSNTSIKGKKYLKNKKNKCFFYKFFKIVFTFPTYLYLYDALLTPSYHLLLIKPKNTSRHLKHKNTKSYLQINSVVNKKKMCVIS